MLRYLYFIRCCLVRIYSIASRLVNAISSFSAITIASLARASREPARPNALRVAARSQSLSTIYRTQRCLQAGISLSLFDAFSFCLGLWLMPAFLPRRMAAYSSRCWPLLVSGRCGAMPRRFFMRYMRGDAWFRI
jgi:hypothetical protein